MNVNRIIITHYNMLKSLLCGILDKRFEIIPHDDI